MPSSNLLRIGGVLLLLLMAFPLLMAGQPAAAKNSVHVDNKKKVITITVNVVMIGKAEKAVFLREAFNNYWGKPGYRYRCYDVVLKAKITASKTKKSGEHTVFVFPPEPWDVSTVSKPRNYNPTTDSGVGHWSDLDDANVVAHEFGHFFGLGDEYSYHDKNNNKRRDFDERSYPDPSKAPEYTWNDKDKDKQIDPGEVSLKPGETSSLMAEWDEGKSQILQRHIDEIAKKHAPRGSIDCKWKGTVQYHSTLTHVAPDWSGAQEFPLQMTLEFEEDENGVLSGRGEATTNYMAEFTASGCGAWEVATPETFPVLVSGNHAGEEMQLVVQSDGPTPAISFTATNCGGYSSTNSSPLFWWLEDPSLWPPTTLVAVGDDNVYQYDETGLLHEVYPTGGSVTGSDTSIVIVVEPVTDEAVPVS